MACIFSRCYLSSNTSQVQFCLSATSAFLLIRLWRPLIATLDSHFEYLLQKVRQVIIIIIIKGIYIAQVRKGHKCAMSAEMAVATIMAATARIATTAQIIPSYSSGSTTRVCLAVASRSLQPLSANGHTQTTLCHVCSNTQGEMTS